MGHVRLVGVVRIKAKRPSYPYSETGNLRSSPYHCSSFPGGDSPPAEHGGSAVLWGYLKMLSLSW